MSFLSQVWSYVDALAHPAAQQDALTLARHRAFIASRLLGSLGAIASLPVYIFGRGVPTTLEVGIFSWFAVPILIAYYLSRTGLYERAHLLSSVSVTALVIQQIVIIDPRTHEIVAVRLPFEGVSGTSTGDLIKFVPERARGIAMTANIQVKKSA